MIDGPPLPENRWLFAPFRGTLSHNTHWGATVPKIVDHDQRRAYLLDALWRVVASQGAAAVTVRSVAAEAGVSKSNVGH